MLFFTLVRFVPFCIWWSSVGCLVRKMCCKPTSMKNENWLPFGFLQRSSFLRLIWAAQSTNSKLIAFTKAEECCFHINLWIASPSAHTAEKNQLFYAKLETWYLAQKRSFKSSTWLLVVLNWSPIKSTENLRFGPNWLFKTHFTPFKVNFAWS